MASRFRPEARVPAASGMSVPNSTRAPREDIPGLTSLRFFAALAVVLYHTLPPVDLPGWHLVWQTTRSGATGVGLFFVLSGFILFHVYGPDLALGRFSLRTFLSARIARIYPVYLLGLVLSLPGFAAGAWHNFHSGTDYLQAAIATPLLLQAWIPDAACHWNCPGWSVSVEAFFYLVFPFVGLMVVGISRSRVVPLLVAVYVLMLLAPALFVTAGLSTADARTNLNLNPDLIALRFNPMVRLPEFIIGVLVGRLAMQSRWRPPFWIVPLSAAAIFAILYWSYDLPRRLSETFVENGLYTPFFALLIAAIARSSRPILAEPIWVRLGAASYALYIIHMPIWGMARFAGRVGAIGNVESNIPLYGCYLAVVLGGSLLVHRYIEQPCRYAIRRRLRNAAPFARPAANVDTWVLEQTPVERHDFAARASQSEPPPIPPRPAQGMRS